MIRLKRIGRKHDPSYRIVVTEKFRGPKSGKYIEKVGFYDAKKDVRVVDGERVKHLMSVGAQVSDTVHNILVKENVIDAKTKNVLPKKSPIIDEEALKAEEEAKAAAEAAANEEASKSEEAPAETEETPAEEAPAEEAPAEEASSEEEKTE